MLRHYAVDTLERMERRGSITAGMRRAGEEFRACFQAAQVDPLQARDLTKPQVDCAPGFDRSPYGVLAGSAMQRARDRVWGAILDLGGHASPGGSCLWHVVGWEKTLKEWAIEPGWGGRKVSQETASGILIAALSTLEGYWASTRRPSS